MTNLQYSKVYDELPISGSHCTATLVPESTCTWGSLEGSELNDTIKIAAHWLEPESVFTVQQYVPVSDTFVLCIVSVKLSSDCAIT